MAFSIRTLKKMVPNKVWDSLTIRFRKGPIDSVQGLTEFVQTRAAYVAQTSLYGYLKNRMGIKYPEMFADETMAASIDLAKWRTYGSCLADLAIFAAASTGAEGRMSEQATAALAAHCFHAALNASFEDPGAQDLMDEIAAQFEARAADANWSTAAEGENAFEASPVDLVRHAPIADELKELDVDIVVNSTRFRWRDIRTQLRERLEPAAISAEWIEASKMSAHET